MNKQVTEIIAKHQYYTIHL